MVRSELIQKLCNQHPNLLRKDVERILEIIFLEITEALCRGENVEITTFLEKTSNVRCGLTGSTRQHTLDTARNEVVLGKDLGWWCLGSGSFWCGFGGVWIGLVASQILWTILPGTAR